MPKLYPQRATLPTDNFLIKRPGSTEILYITSENLIDDTLDAIRIEPTVSVDTQLGDVIAIAIQLAHPSTKEALDEQKGFYAYLASDSEGTTLTANAPDGGWAKGTEGTIINLVANKAAIFVTNDEGLVDITITESSTKSFYLVMLMPDGILYGPVEIAFDASVSP